MKNRNRYHSKELGDLIKLAKQDDQRAFTELYNRFNNYIGYVISKNMQIKDLNIVEELQQDTFAKAFTQIHSYKDDYSFGYWLKRIAINTTIDYIRKQNAEVNTFDTDYGTELKDTHATNDPVNDKITKIHNDTVLTDAVNQLKWKDRRIYNLRYVDGLRYKDIASELGVSVGTIKSHLWHVRQKLDKIVQTTN